MDKLNLTYLTTFLLLLLSFQVCAQEGTISGRILHQDKPIAYAHVLLEGTEIGTSSDVNGNFVLNNVPFGNYVLLVSSIAHRSGEIKVAIGPERDEVELSISLEILENDLEEVVVTGTKTEYSLKESPILANVLNAKELNNVQACNLSEGLKFQPGLRVETDCQTCNYTQLRMNGLAGSYSQILINGRPVFSPLTGLYGLEQLPINMVERIEVIRGGGSSLYGSSAIGGTVNVITKLPKKNAFEFSHIYQNINAQSSDFQFNGNASLISSNKKTGVNFLFNKRLREWYDHNGDNFSEAPELDNTSFGAGFFYTPEANHKIEVNVSHLREERYGGEMIDTLVHLTQQAEDRDHKIWMASIDYQINSKDEKTSLINYFSFQNTDRTHYTGIQPDEPEELLTFIENPPYGTSRAYTLNGGFQVNRKVDKLISGQSIFTLGAEYLLDDVFDEIVAYSYLIDQRTQNFGFFLQNDWSILPGLTFLSGLRADVHNLTDNTVFSPRFALLYKASSQLRLRGSFGTGFRAPQAFDADLHIAFAGGGISRVSLSPNLLPEKSQSLSFSLDYDKAFEKAVYGITLEAFYTRLKDAFILQPVGEDEVGELFEKQNSEGAEVQGIVLELRANLNRKVQVETGFTFQSSLFQEEVQYIDDIPGIREFIRTPNLYGFANISISPINGFSANLNYVNTGSMRVPHFAGAPNQLVDEIIESEVFHELNTKIAYGFSLKNKGTYLELSAGVKNILNQYQDDFDIGKNRDSNYVYGPALPRTYFVGVAFKTR